jgi:hypothetical protein
MATRTGSSSNTLLLALVLIITFPFWIAIGGILIGVFAGIFGAIIGLIGGLFGLIVGLIALPFKLIFGWGHHHDWGYHAWPHFHMNGFTFIAVIIIAGIILSKRK